ncbi:hypothetical protein IWW50_000107 [Coemansia erecta]|nr:hypothetical protein IWW50_000107 [Coemansia erecta]
MNHNTQPPDQQLLPVSSHMANNQPMQPLSPVGSHMAGKQSIQAIPPLLPPRTEGFVPHVLAPPHTMAWGAHRPPVHAETIDYRHHPYPQMHYYPYYEHFDGPVYSPHQVPQLPRRVRCTQACNHCHRRKARCVRNMLADGSVRCDNCIREGIVCEWRESRRRGPKRRTKADAPAQPRNAASLANLLNASINGEPGSGPAANNGTLSPINDRANSLVDETAFSDKPGGVTQDNASATVGDSSGTAERISTTAERISPTTDRTSPTAKRSSSQSQTRPRRKSRSQHYVLPACRLPKHLRAPESGDLLARFMQMEDVELREAVVAYYTYFYGFCPILHPSTLLHKAVSGTLDPLLDDSLRATTSMFVSKKLERKIDADALFARLVTAITIRPSAPSLDEVCAFQLASIGVSGVRGFVCFDTLKSAVTSLLVQLNWHELDRYEALGAAATWQDWVDAEVKRRVFWINYKIDSHHASIAGRPPVIDEEKVFVRAPCSDAEWDELSSELLVRNCCCDETAPMAYPAGPWSAVSEDSSEDSAANSSHSSNSSSTGGRHQVTCRSLASRVQEELSRSFRLITPYESFMARISTLQRDAKASFVQRSEAAETARLLGESDMFKRYDAEIQQWRAEQVVASALRDTSLPPWRASFFGSVRHRIFLVRVRYYCINIYAPGVTILLHSANRRSFFAEAQQTIVAQASRDSSTSPPLAPRETRQSFSASRDSSTSPPLEPTTAEDEQIARILNQTFGPTWCQGLVATDIEPPSWRLCVACAHELADVLRANDDIPLEFLDMVIPLFLFVGITVLLRQIRRCQAKLASHDSWEDEQAALRSNEWDEELKRCLRDAQVLWRAIRSMGSVWRIDGISKLLGNMHIDEVEKAAEQLASMCL